MPATQVSQSGMADGRRRERGRAFRARRRRLAGSSAPIKVNIAPMIDMTFLLLIFVLVTATFEPAEGVLVSKLPKETGVALDVALPISPIVVRLSQVGVEADDYQIRIDNFSRVPTSFVELAGFIRQIQEKPGFDKETPVVIVAEETVRWDHVVGAWNAAVSARCVNIAFGE